MQRLILLALLLSNLAAATKVAIINDGPSDGPAKHGLTVLEASLRAKNIEIVADPAEADSLILFGNTQIATEWHATPPPTPEALAIRHGRYQNKPALLLAGSDSRGLMYAAVSTADRISNGTPLTAIPNATEKPFIEQRGVSMYTMQRAYFEARLYDPQYWQRYFDLLAASRINNFVVIFGYENGGFMAPLYPYFFNVEQYPGVEFVGLTVAQQKRNRDAFNDLIHIAHDRGISITAGIWDHIYRGGVQGGGIPGASDNAGKRVPGLVFGVTADNLSGYTKAALNRFLEVFPDIDAIQFRMHDESGLKPSEMQSFWHDVFVSIKQTHPKLRLDLRAKGLPDAVINDAVDLGLNAQISTKYWMEQMGLPFHPTHINTQNQRDRRQGYADLLHYPQTYRVHWQLWNGGTSRVLLWADPEYVRRFAASVRLYDGNSFEVNEMLATWMLGEPHDEPPLDIFQPAARRYHSTYDFERYWHFYQVWGRVSYNPLTTDDLWRADFTGRFGPEAGPHLMNALHRASAVLPRIVAASYLYSNFPTTRGWAEMNRQGSLQQYANEDGSDIQQFMNVRDEAQSIIAGTDTAMRRPEETSQWFARTSAAILTELNAAGEPTNKEFETTAADLKILAGLARYHSWRLLAGVSYNLYKQAGDVRSFDDAIQDERNAIQAWSEIVAAAGNIYSENLAFGAHAVGFSRHWKEEYQLLNSDFEKLLAERQAAVARTDHHYQPRDVRKAPVITILPAKDREVQVKAADPATIKSIRLRYRHTTQFEDYETVAMTLDPTTGLYTAAIPDAFVNPKWGLTYFVEVIGNDGSGRIYPDLENETPYITK